jgi:Na+/proline symporter
VREVRDDNNRVQRLTFLLWLIAFLVCLSVLGFIGFGYLRHALDAFPKLG